MENKKPEIKYSDPVEEIMSDPPRRILRWGTLVIFFLFILFTLFAWLIKYPDLIPSPVQITTQNPPVTLVSKINGRIKHLYIENKSNAAKGQVLAVMETAASYTDFKILQHFVDTVSNLILLKNINVPQLNELGELQVHYGTFRKLIADYNNYITNDYYKNKIQSLNDEIKGTAVYIERLKQSERLYSEDMALDTKRFQRDSTLFRADKAIPESEYEKSRQTLISKRLGTQEIRLQLSAKNIEQLKNQQLLKEYSIKRAEEIEKLTSSITESFQNLRAEISLWEMAYLLISPINGTVTFTKYWSENQSVRKDEPVLSLIPKDQGNYIGRINLKMQRSGKVVIGQEVNIKLSSFPYLEYGMVRGRIKTKSLVPSDDVYIIEIELPDGLNTRYNRTLEFTQNMQGTAEIVTNDMSLLEKMINPFRYLLSKNKR